MELLPSRVLLRTLAPTQLSQTDLAIFFRKNLLRRPIGSSARCPRRPCEAAAPRALCRWAVTACCGMVLQAYKLISRAVQTISPNTIALKQAKTNACKQPFCSNCSARQLGIQGGPVEPLPPVLRAARPGQACSSEAGPVKAETHLQSFRGL
jgi:hypothetical protein